MAEEEDVGGEGPGGGGRGGGGGEEDHALAEGEGLGGVGEGGEGEGGGLARGDDAAGGLGALEGLHEDGLEGAGLVGAGQEVVALPHDARLHQPRRHHAHPGHLEQLVHVEAGGELQLGLPAPVLSSPTLLIQIGGKEPVAWAEGGREEVEKSAELGETLAGDAGDGEDGDGAVGGALGGGDGVVGAGDEDGETAEAGSLEEIGELALCGEPLGDAGDVDLGEDDEEGDLEGGGDGEVLPRRSHQPRVRRHHEAAEVRPVPRQPEHCCSQELQGEMQQ